MITSAQLRALVAEALDDRDRANETLIRYEHLKRGLEADNAKLRDEVAALQKAHREVTTLATNLRLELQAAQDSRAQS